MILVPGWVGASPVRVQVLEQGVSHCVRILRVWVTPSCALHQAAWGGAAETQGRKEEATRLLQRQSGPRGRSL